MSPTISNFFQSLSNYNFDRGILDFIMGHLCFISTRFASISLNNISNLLCEAYLYFTFLAHKFYFVYLVTIQALICYESQSTQLHFQDRGLQLIYKFHKQLSKSHELKTQIELQKKNFFVVILVHEDFQQHTTDIGYVHTLI